jgi:hypothetical protein
LHGGLSSRPLSGRRIDQIAKRRRAVGRGSGMTDHAGEFCFLNTEVPQIMPVTHDYVEQRGGDY